MSGVIFDRRIVAKLKGKIYKRVLVLFGLETVALTKRRENELVVAELKYVEIHFGSDKDGLIHMVREDILLVGVKEDGEDRER